MIEKITNKEKVESMHNRICLWIVTATGVG